MDKLHFAIGDIITAPAALALLLLFFAPWTHLSCTATETQLVELSAYDIASGAEINPLEGLVDLTISLDAYPT